MPDNATSPKFDAKPCEVAICWLLSGDWAADAREASVAAAHRMRLQLAKMFAAFEWHVEVRELHDRGGDKRIEPVLLLDDAELERDRNGQDFVFVLTESELVSYTQPFTFAAPSRVFSAAIVSTARIAERDSGTSKLERRLFALAMHLFGRLNDLETTQTHGFMRDLEDPRELDEMDGFDEGETESLRRSLALVADPRVEEMKKRRKSTMSFYLRSFWENRQTLPRSVFRMRPWAFPKRLSRLTTASGSALAVLMMTAESWEVASHLQTEINVLLSALSLVLTSAYLLSAQRLLARPGDRALRELRAVSNIGTVLAVGIGMTVTYLALFAVSYATGALLFQDVLLSGWVGQNGLQETSLRVQMAALTAAVSLVIGALGASFEPYGYFRHVTHIDDEI